MQVARKVLGRLASLNARGSVRTQTDVVHGHNMSVCLFHPRTALLEAALHLFPEIIARLPSNNN